jgi:hypothetical protein
MASKVNQHMRAFTFADDAAYLNAKLSASARGASRNALIGQLITLLASDPKGEKVLTLTIPVLNTANPRPDTGRPMPLAAPKSEKVTQVPPPATKTAPEAQGAPGATLGEAGPGPGEPIKLEFSSWNDLATAWIVKTVAASSVADLVMLLVEMTQASNCELWLRQAWAKVKANVTTANPEDVDRAVWVIVSHPAAPDDVLTEVRDFAPSPADVEGGIIEELSSRAGQILKARADLVTALDPKSSTKALGDVWERVTCEEAYTAKGDPDLPCYIERVLALAMHRRTPLDVVEQLSKQAGTKEIRDRASDNLARRASKDSKASP